MVRRKVAQEKDSLTMMGEDVADPGGETEPQTTGFDVQAEFQKVYDKAIKLGLTQKDFAQMEILRDIAFETSNRKVFAKCGLMVFSVAVFLFSLLFLMLILGWPVPREKLISGWFMVNGLDIDHEPCVINMPESVVDLLRPPVECFFCENMDHVDTVTDISPAEFEEKYAYTGVPVVISDGAKNWTATQAFSFDFFKGIYKEGSPALENHEKHCQFFPYKTNFESLVDVMEMNESMANMEEGSKPWYVGWSNCDFSAANILRQHYKRPYFLPKLSESSKTDWIFMGSPGYGAHMHIDNVGNPSWQAQITGTKRWTLQPPPECYFTCPESLEVTVHPGQIIVLDTNIWYHSTLNVGDSISITIGSEYD